jgi:transcriptional regulator with GAF, ATPase, and Fis domain
MKQTTTGGGKRQQPSHAGVVETRISRNWHLMVGVTIMSTLGMIVSVAPILGERLGSVWPWPNTHLVLLGGLAVSVVMLVAHLTIQQKKLSAIHGEVKDLEDESAERDRQNHARLKALLNIGRMMGSVTRLDKVFDSIIDTCIELFDAQQASLMLLNPETNELEVRAAKGHLDSKGVNIAKSKIGEGVAGWVAKHRRPLVLGAGFDRSRHPDLDVNVSELTGSVVVPILLRDELVGVLSIRSREAGANYNEDDLQSLRVLAENIGVVIRHSEHVEWLRKTVEKQRADKPTAPVG